MLAPACGACGCSLDAVAVPACDVVDAGGFVLPSSAVVAMRVLGVLACVLVMYAAVRLGWHEAGASGGLVAFGAGGFLLLPFVPERI